MHATRYTWSLYVQPTTVRTPCYDLPDVSLLLEHDRDVDSSTRVNIG
jgi:hypothetical protein